MLRRIKMLFFTLLISFSIMVPIYSKEVREISDERAIILVNYLQYSLAQIITNPNNRIIASHEFEKLELINDSTLKDMDIIQAKTDMQKSLSALKINGDEREYIEIIAARERENAIYSIFSSAGSVFVPGQNPILSIAYASINAGLNYAGSIKRAKDAEFDNRFKNWEDLKRIIDDTRINLHDKTAKAFAYRNDTSLLVSTTHMTDFTDALAIEDLASREHTLSELKPNLEMFPPFWFALGYFNYRRIINKKPPIYVVKKENYKQHKNGKYEEAIESYNKYNEILSDEKILIYDEIASQVYLSLIDIYIAIDVKTYKKEINQCLNKIYSQIDSAPVAAKKQLRYSVGKIYEMLGESEKSKKEFVILNGYGDKNWENTEKNLIEIVNGTYKEYSYNEIPAKNNIEESKNENNKTILLGVLIIGSAVFIFSIIIIFIYFIFIKKKEF